MTEPAYIKVPLRPLASMLLVHTFREVVDDPDGAEANHDPATCVDCLFCDALSPEAWAALAHALDELGEFVLKHARTIEGDA
jgi:hypothetical protein